MNSAIFVAVAIFGSAFTPPFPASNLNVGGICLAIRSSSAPGVDDWTAHADIGADATLRTLRIEFPQQGVVDVSINSEACAPSEALNFEAGSASACLSTLDGASLDRTIVLEVHPVDGVSTDQLSRRILSVAPCTTDRDGGRYFHGDRLVFGRQLLGRIN